MKNPQNTAVLLIHCPDQKGIIHAVTDFLYKNNGNIISMDEHVDASTKHFFMRIEWDLDGFNIPENKIDDFFKTLIGDKFNMAYQLHFTNRPLRMAIFVSKMSHCLYDILQRYKSGEWEIEIPLIISNHPNLADIAKRFEIDYHIIPITKETKQAQEAKEIELLKEYDIDFIVLARYMQILSDNFITHYENKVINIHHSFLPAFAGAKPYHAAFKRGVKIIGATSHYVTAELDAGPIIAQDVTHISHKETVKDLIRKGKDLEKLVLSRAIWAHLNHKVLPYQNKTIVF